jgi:hypothetical protein
MTAQSAGYSGTPLVKKLGIVAEMQVVVLGAPPRYTELLDPIPPRVRFTARPTAKTDLVHLFVDAKSKLEDQLTRLRDKLRSDAVLWVSWPKKASKIATDVTEDTIREVALPLGFVDVKVCAVNEIWSGLKLVVRKELRRRCVGAT